MKIFSATWNAVRKQMFLESITDIYVHQYTKY